MRLERVPETLSDFLACAIVDVRKQRGLSQADMAKRMGVLQPMASRLELNSVPLTVDMLVRVARVLETPPHVLVRMAEKALEKQAEPKKARRARKKI